MLKEDTSAAVCFLIPYWGSLPSYAELFLESCRFNRRIHVILFLDQETSFQLPENVEAVILPRFQLQDRLESYGGLRLGACGGHKLCDFKPHYGSIFQDFTAPYPWWGFCDLDMMFGDVDRWVVETLDESCNVYTAHDRIIAGHFTVVRNLPQVAQAIASMLDQPMMRERFAHPTCQMLDEYPFLAHVRNHPDLRLHMPASLASCLQKPFAPYGITFCFDGSVAELPTREFGVTIWNRGKVWYQSPNIGRREVLYLHFMGTKRWWHWIFYHERDQAGGCFSFSKAGYDPPLAMPIFAEPVREGMFLIQNILEGIRSMAGLSLRKCFGQERFRLIRRFFINGPRY